jgi:hypothetical protein
MRELLGDLPFNPALALDVETPRGEYNDVARQYYEALDGVAKVAASGAMFTRPVTADMQHVQDVVTWRLDGDILDNRFDFATRLAVRVADSAIAPEHLPTPPLAEHALPVDRAWPEPVRALGQNSLRLLGVEWRHVPLIEMKPHETVGSAIAFAQFTHRLPAGPQRYKADPAGGEVKRLAPPTAYDTVAATAYGRFTMRLASDVLSGMHADGLARAIQDDQGDRGHRTDNLAEYRAATVNVPDAGARISDLAAALYDAAPTEFTTQLVGQLMRPDAAEVAAWALMDKGRYHLRARAQGGTLLTHRLQWLKATAPAFQAELHDRMVSSSGELADELQAKIETMRASVAEAQQLESDLAPPYTIAVNPSDWKVRPK